LLIFKDLVPLSALAGAPVDRFSCLTNAAHLTIFVFSSLTNKVSAAPAHHPTLARRRSSLTCTQLPEIALVLVSTVPEQRSCIIMTKRILKHHFNVVLWKA
jgi:hypothetical protein